MKERIIKEALNLFWRYGIKSVTMDDIAKELGISKRTIYQHYPDKDAILELVISQELGSQKCELDEIEENVSNPIAQLIKTSDQMQVYLVNMNPALFYDLKKYYPKAWQLFQTHKNEYIIQSIKENLKHGMELGLYRSDTDIETLALLRVHEFEMGFDPTIFPPGKFSMMRVQVQLVHHFLRGILTPKGFDYYYTITKESAIESNTHEK